MIRTIYFPATGTPQKDLSRDDIRQKLSHPDGWVWVSLENANEAEINEYLNQLFHFHPLAIEDCLSAGYQTPKIDDYNSYIFIVAHVLSNNHGKTEIETNELDLFLGKNFLVSVDHCEIMTPVVKVWRKLERDERLQNNGPDFLCHSLLDMLVDEYLPYLDHLEDEIELLEDRILEKPKTEYMSQILDLKHITTSLRRVVSPQREMMNRLSRDEFAMVDRQSRIYFRDIYDHLVRIQEMSENIRDMISSALEVYLNATSMRLNEVMKALTIVSTIFLPLSFVAGVYGMNFTYMPEIQWIWGYPFVWLIFISIVIGMLVFFKKRGWF